MYLFIYSCTYIYTYTVHVCVYTCTQIMCAYTHIQMHTCLSLYSFTCLFTTPNFRSASEFWKLPEQRGLAACGRCSKYPCRRRLPVKCTGLPREGSQLSTIPRPDMASSIYTYMYAYIYIYIPDIYMYVKIYMLNAYLCNVRFSSSPHAQPQS